MNPRTIWVTTDHAWPKTLNLGEATSRAVNEVRARFGQLPYLRSPTAAYVGDNHLRLTWGVDSQYLGAKMRAAFLAPDVSDDVSIEGAEPVESRYQGDPVFGSL